MYWQIGDPLFGIATCIVLSAYAALVISVVCLIRNILSYKGKKINFINYKYLHINTVLYLIKRIFHDNTKQMAAYFRCSKKMQRICRKI
ncbi:MAG: hypothetical protein E7012_03005 [Alphaproteobacteria bacterium]|nr:hypothetical protein [Alphaproteobacteria bacterium]